MQEFEDLLPGNRCHPVGLLSLQNSSSKERNLLNDMNVLLFIKMP